MTIRSRVRSGTSVVADLDDDRADISAHDAAVDETSWGAGRVDPYYGDYGDYGDYDDAAAAEQYAPEGQYSQDGYDYFADEQSPPDYEAVGRTPQEWSGDPHDEWPGASEPREGWADDRWAYSAHAETPAIGGHRPRSGGDARRSRTRRTDPGRPGGGQTRQRPERQPSAAKPDAAIYRRRQLTVAALIALGLFGGYWLLSERGESTASADSAIVVAATAAPAASEAPATSVAQQDSTALEDVACTIEDFEIRSGSEGASVECAQQALLAAGYDYVEPTGVYDDTTEVAVSDFQGDYGLYVDGLLGKRTAIELGIWPGDEAFITRTPEPPAGATDLWGVPLSPVASAGDDAPPLPENAGQGTGKRVVYDRAGQRVWAIDAQEQVVRSYLVSGSRFKNEVPGEHTVYSKTESALGWDLKADLPYMVRYTRTDLGHIGFHAIPSWRDSGEKLQTTDELGTKLSGGCTRQHLQDAQFMWQFANVGTRVIVL